MSPLHTSLSRFAPSTRVDVPFVMVVFSHQSGLEVNAKLSATGRMLEGTIALPRLGSMVSSWVV